jgi:hypothetical protein
MTIDELTSGLCWRKVGLLLGSSKPRSACLHYLLLKRQEIAGRPIGRRATGSMTH